MALHEWTMWSRESDYTLNRSLPIIEAKLLLKHLGVDTAVITTPFSAESYAALQPSNGVVLYRDGRQEFTGLVGPLDLDWDGESGRAVIKAHCYSDLQHLADRPVFPEPLKAPDDQQPADYWTFTGVASSAMLDLVSDQAGPTCHVGRRVTGLVLGADPGVGTSRTWSGLFTSAGDRGVLDLLTVMSLASGEDLGVRVSTAPGALTVDIVQPRDLADSAVFAVTMGNLAAVSYRIAPPTVTDALSAGQGDLHLRLRRYASTASTFALSWGRRIWSYIDRRDTAATAELDKANTDALAEGDATVSLAVTLLDSQAGTYGVDWERGDRITVHVGVPGLTTPVATVSDVVREVLIEVGEDGAERIRPAIGTYDAKALIPTPTQLQLVEVGRGFAGLISHK